MKSPVPVAALDDRLGWVGTSGSGKTYNAGGSVEQLLASGARVVIVDPLDVWFGLRLLADGKTPSPYPVVIFGGAHADLPVNEHAGALIGETVAGMAESCIVSLGGMTTKAAERRFMLAFLESLYRKANGEPFHVIFDEADLWAPQKAIEPMLQNLMEQIVRRGRVKGFIPWLITQRPAVISKDVLSQVDGLIAFKLTSSQDRDALEGWIEGQADRQEWKAIRAQLPTMARGVGVIWIPGRGVLETKTFPEKLTFDSSRTPKRGEKKRKAAELVPLDLPALKERLAKVEADVKANDPKLLKAEIARLTRELAKPKELAVDVDMLARTRTEGKLEGYKEAIRALVPMIDRMQTLRTALDEQLGGLIDDLGKWRERHETLPAQAAHQSPHKRQSTAPALPHVVSAPTPPKRSKDEFQIVTERGGKPIKITGGPAVAIPKGERAILIALAQYPAGCARDQLSILTGYKRSSRDTYVQRLRERGFADVRGDLVVATGTGIAALGSDFEPLPTGASLLEHWLERLPAGEAVILRLVAQKYPQAADRDWLSAHSDYQRSSRDTYIQRLRARKLVDAVGRGEVMASDVLFG